MPMTWRPVSMSGPPELPGLIAASVCTRSLRSGVSAFGARSRVWRTDTTPLVEDRLAAAREREDPCARRDEQGERGEHGRPARAAAEVAQAPARRALVGRRERLGHRGVLGDVVARRLLGGEAHDGRLAEADLLVALED